MTLTAVETTPLPPLNLTLQNGQKIHYHSDTSIEADEIPVIDISGIYSNNLEDRKAVAEKVREAAHRIGFFYIVNHGIDSRHAANTFEQAKRFFSQSEQKKMEVCTDLVTEYFGYFPMARVSTHSHNVAVTKAYNSITEMEREKKTSWRLTIGATVPSSIQR